MECNIECVSWAIYWHDCKLTLFNLMSHVIVHKKIINKANAVMSENVYEQVIIPPPPSGHKCLPIPSLKSPENVVAKLYVVIKNTI